MNNPSPYSHLYRLAALLLVMAIAFLTVKALLIPESWNHVAWYRSDALEDMKKLTVVHGDNDSCQSCHEEVFETQMDFEHATLNCESCHGPLTEHALGEEKIGDALVMNETDWQCMNCHRDLISRPKDFPLFLMDVKKHRNIEAGELCLECHDAHEP